MVLGRAIRNLSDYCAILLIDERYASVAIQRKLPKWVQNSINMITDFETLLISLRHVSSDL